MKITALIDEFQEIEIDRTQLFQKIKSKTNADALIVVTSGNFTQKGLSGAVDKYKKADILKKQGADLVLELPVYCTLTTFDTFAFAAVSMLEKLNCVNELAILCEDVDETCMKEIVQFLFIEPKEYQEKVKLIMKNGSSFADACKEVTEEFIPGAKHVLEKPQNIQAIEYAKAMKRMYSTMKVTFIDVGECHKNIDASEFHKKQERSDIEEAKAFEIVLGEQIKQKLVLHTDEQNVKYLNEISGGYAPTTKQIMDVYHEQTEADNTFFERLADAVTNQNHPREELRRYLLKVLIGVRHVEITICGLYSYALYVRALGDNQENDVYELIKKHSWIPVLSECDEEEAKKNIELPEMDDSRKMLLELDWKAQELYDIMGEN
mgnify:CR=1 FL=1